MMAMIHFVYQICDIFVMNTKLFCTQKMHIKLAGFCNFLSILRYFMEEVFKLISCDWVIKQPIKSLDFEYDSDSKFLIALNRDQNMKVSTYLLCTYNSRYV